MGSKFNVPRYISEPLLTYFPWWCFNIPIDDDDDDDDAHIMKW